MEDSLAGSNPTQRKWRRALAIAMTGLFIYLVSVGPVTRCAPDFADWLYAPLSPLADAPLAGSILRGWVSVWGVNIY